MQNGAAADTAASAVPVSPAPLLVPCCARRKLTCAHAATRSCRRTDLAWKPSLLISFNRTLSTLHQRTPSSSTTETEAEAEVEAEAEAVVVWRRSDPDPFLKAVF